MATEIEQDQPTCAKCGSDIRRDTAFCYKCGAQVRAVSIPDVAVESSAETEMDENTRSALDDLALRLEKDAKDDKQLAKAASERRRARVAQRKPKAQSWEPDEGSPAILLILVTGIVVVIAIFVVYFTTIAK